MGTTLLHLSDIHLKNSHSEIIDDLSRRIAYACSSSIDQYDDVIVLVSGDLVYSGKKEEYELFNTFLENIENSLLSQGRVSRVSFVAVPGNHDCDFSVDKSVREVILKSLDEKFDSTLTEFVVRVNKNFFDYIKTKINYTSKVNDIYYELEIGDFRFVCFNTAWCSRLHEEPGKLKMPFELNLVKTTNNKITVVTYHHPTNWLNPQDAHSFKKATEAIADFIFTGHEHSPDILKKTRKEDEVVYFEAGALLQNQPYSIFNVLNFDTKFKRYRYRTYRVVSDEKFAKIIDRSDYVNYENKSINKSLKLKDIFYKWVLEIDPIISNGKDLTLKELYIYPDLQVIDIANKDKDEEVIKSNEVFSYINSTSEDVVVIHGDLNSGKTALCKKIFDEYYNKGYFPLIIRGFEIKNSNDREIILLINICIKEQYEKIDIEEYMQIEKMKRILIIDDFDMMSSKIVNVQSCLSDLSSYFCKIILTSNIDSLESIIRDLKTQSLIKIGRYEIRSMNARMRTRLIEMYFSQLFPEKNHNFYEKMDQAENAITSALRTRMISSYPIYILGILKYYEDSSVPDNMGSNNFVYDLLVRYSMARISRKDADYSIIKTFLSNLAFHMHSTEQIEIDKKALYDFVDNHINEYKLKNVIRRDKLINLLLESGILRESESFYGFKHKHLYSYFVASYIQANYSENNIKKEIIKMTDSLDVSNNVNILLFLVFLTNDYNLVDNIMRNLENIISGFEEMSIEDCAIGVREIAKSIPKIVYNEVDVVKARENAAESLSGDLDEEINSHKVKKNEETEEDEEFEKIPLALRLMEVLGQIVKNHVGSWDGTKKALILDLCYRTGTRVNGMILRYLSQVLTSITLNEINRYFDKNNKDRNERVSYNERSQIIKEITGYVYGLMEFTCFSMIHRVTKAVGASQLIDVYGDILNTLNGVTFKLIDANIDMNHNTNYPVTKIIDLDKELRNENDFASRILKRLVVMHFNTHQRPNKIVNRVLDSLDIPVDKKIIEVNAYRER